MKKINLNFRKIILVLLLATSSSANAKTDFCNKCIPATCAVLSLATIIATELVDRYCLCPSINKLQDKLKEQSDAISGHVSGDVLKEKFAKDKFVRVDDFVKTLEKYRRFDVEGSCINAVNLIVILKNYRKVRGALALVECLSFIAVVCSTGLFFKSCCCPEKDEGKDFFNTEGQQYPDERQNEGLASEEMKDILEDVL